MVEVKMLSTIKISQNSFSLQQLYKGKTYQISPQIAQSLIFFDKALPTKKYKEKTMSKYPFLHIKTEPLVEVLSLDEIKSYLRINSNEDDDLLNNLQIAVRKTAESYTSKAFVQQEWEVVFDDLGSEKIILPITPIISLLSIKYLDKNDNEIIINESDYYLCKIQSVVTLKGTYKKIIVNYIAGYSSDSSNVPSSIKQGMLNHIAFIYDGKGSPDKLPFDTKILYSSFKKIRI